MDHDERFANLEATVAFQDRTIRELHEVILRQQTQIERIEADLKRSLEARERLVRDAAHEEPPPHY